MVDALRPWCAALVRAGGGVQHTLAALKSGPTPPRFDASMEPGPDPSAAKAIRDTESRYWHGGSEANGWHPSWPVAGCQMATRPRNSMNDDGIALVESTGSRSSAVGSKRLESSESPRWRTSTPEPSSISIWTAIVYFREGQAKHT